MSKLLSFLYASESPKCGFSALPPQHQVQQSIIYKTTNLSPPQKAKVPSPFLLLLPPVAI